MLCFMGGDTQRKTPSSKYIVFSNFFTAVILCLQQHGFLYTLRLFHKKLARRTRKLFPLQPKISIIVPVYNVEAYLPACLSSVSTKQWLKSRLSVSTMAVQITPKEFSENLQETTGESKSSTRKTEDCPLREMPAWIISAVKLSCFWILTITLHPMPANGYGQRCKNSQQIF